MSTDPAAASALEPDEARRSVTLDLRATPAAKETLIRFAEALARMAARMDHERVEAQRKP